MRVLGPRAAMRISVIGFIMGLLSMGCAAQRGSGSWAAPRPAKQTVLDGLRSPWSIAFIDDDTALITEKEGGLLLAALSQGRVTEVDGLPEDLVSDVRAAVASDNGGLFDVVLDPKFPDNGWVYLSYAAQNNDGRTTKVVRAVLDGTRLTGLQTLLVASPYTDNEYYHYGGGLVFGPDGYLYITVGERVFNEKDEPALPVAQDVADQRGKIYRIRPDGTIPDDNPDFGPQAVPGLFAIGIRAAQGLALDPRTRRLWFSEHGSRQGDEINRLAPGANYGWPIVTTGTYRYADYKPPAPEATTFEPPVWSWPHTVAPTGLVFYQGSAFPAWQGDLLVSGLSRGSLWRLHMAEDRVVSIEELFVDDRIRSRKVQQSPDGTLYMLTDTLFRPRADGRLEYTQTPGGQLIRIVNCAGQAACP